MPRRSARRQGADVAGSHGKDSAAPAAHPTVCLNTCLAHDTLAGALLNISCMELVTVLTSSQFCGTVS
jgi:hypothetical protein